MLSKSPLPSMPHAFASRGRSWYVRIMVNCYVGIISCKGLESLFPETEHAVPFLLRRAYRRQPTEALCYWAVMQDTAAREVQCRLERRRHEEALFTLRTLAADFGTILPPSFEDTG